MTRTIVKVQLNLIDQRDVLVYDEKREHMFQGEAPKEIIKVMGGEYKKYFYAKVPKKTGFITLQEEAPEQDW